jgi:GH15 family glucan-1,4-alpha-glucosidase
MALIEDYALLGDLHTAALVGRDGAIDWLCLPRFDAPACFAALVGGDDAGTWRLAPVAGGVASRRTYRGETPVLESEWDTREGTVRVVDCMPPRDESAAVVRVVQGLTGRVPMRMKLKFRFDYGHVMPWIRRRGEDLAAVAGPDAVWLRTPVPLRGQDMTTVAEFDVEAGQHIPFVLSYNASHLDRPQPVDAKEAVADTERRWTKWVSACRYAG